MMHRLERIHMEDVSRVFQTPGRGDVAALNGLNLVCMASELVCVVGPSGCGKSTLLRLVAGLDRPTAGRVLLDGTEVCAPRRELAFVSQEGDLLPWRRVAENVGLGLEIRGFKAAERANRVEAALRRVHLPPDISRSFCYELSGGMRQRVALARALCLSPQILLMDEPYSRLDEPTRNKLQDALTEVWMADRQTILFVTHSMTEAVFLADRILIMKEGAVCAEQVVSLPRPRDRYAVTFLEYMRVLRDALGE